MHRDWPRLTNIRVGAAGITNYPPGATFGPRKLREYEFVWIMEGASTASFDGNHIDAPPGTILLSRPGMMDYYQWAERTRTVHAYFHFQCEPPPPPWPESHRWPLSRVMPQEDVLRPLFRYALVLLNETRSLRSSLFAPCVDLMVRAFVAGKTGLLAEPKTDLPPPVEKAMSFIRECARRDPPSAVALADIARAAHVSAEHLCRLFKSNVSVAPLECLRLMRLDRSAALVARSNLTFKEIAEAGGFANAFHFSAAFKAVYGLSPRDYRGAVREGRPVKGNPLVKSLMI
ncbi:MAG TPA: AraC family transcriptional regulator [Chthoniobacteraceae bacterium]|jgi:AraC-like DNA-binding protein|nr:AraC family transcriptional regulator [Chthoniobacteraceae bacterium]